MKKLLTVAAIALATAGFNSTAYASDAEGMMAKATELHNQAKTENYVWKQKKMKKPYFDTYADEYAAAVAKGDTKKAAEAADFALRTAEGEVRQMNETVAAAWDK